MAIEEPPAPAPKKKRAAPATKRKAPVKKSKAENEPTVAESQPSVTFSGSTPNLRHSTSFLDLPPELRNEVYGHNLIKNYPIEVRPTQPYLKEPALSAVNKQVRFEALAIWYGVNIFEIRGSSPAVKFLRSLPDEKLRLLRTLHITTETLMTTDYARERTKQLMREFGPRGLPKRAIQFDVGSGLQVLWADLEEVKRLMKQKTAGAGSSQNVKPSNDTEWTRVV